MVKVYEGRELVLAYAEKTGTLGEMARYVLSLDKDEVAQSLALYTKTITEEKDRIVKELVDGEESLKSQLVKKDSEILELKLAIAELVEGGLS